MKRLAVLDLETDPFEYGQIPRPFAVGLYDSERFISWWGDDCIDKLLAYLAKRREPLVIYAHNGGRFDFFYLLDQLKHAIRIINGRIVQAQLGIHELRDSYAIMPFPLSAYKKDSMDYEWMRADKREKHRDEILSYLRGDCIYLYELVANFTAEFGDKLTIGGAALNQLRQFHPFKCGNEQYDSKFRKDFYFGGRNQVFKSGILKGPWEVYDVNSMYPYVMKAYMHPIGTAYNVDLRIRRDTCFVVARGRNYGAFPRRDEKTGGLDFTAPDGVFYTTIHEWNAAEETGSFRCDKIIKTYGFEERGNFADFIDHYYSRREIAKRRYADSGKTDTEALRETLFTKYVMNSAYGKFAQNPANYFDWQIIQGAERPDPWHDCTEACKEDIAFQVAAGLEGTCRRAWTPAFIHGTYVIWQRPVQMYHYYNLCTGASITGAARAELLKGIHAAIDPIYCDTDSVICRSLSGVSISATELGAWKHEASGSLAAIAGKKLYALFDAEGTCIKKAHKGARLTGEEIKSIASGEVVTSCNPVPAFKFDGNHTFTTRTVKRTC